MMSPALGDFLQLRYVDLGPRPDLPTTGPARCKGSSLISMTAQEMAGRSHFALIVIAKSARPSRNCSAAAPPSRSWLGCGCGSPASPALTTGSMRTTPRTS